MAELTIPEVQAIQAQLATIPTRRGRIFKAMELLLSTLTTSRGYNHDVVTVTTDGLPWENLTTGQVPAITIDDFNTELVTHAGQVREYNLIMLVYGVVREMDLYQFEAFITDVEKAIYDNNSLFGQCNLMRVKNIMTDANFNARIDGTRVFQCMVECLYTRNFNKPE